MPSKEMIEAAARRYAQCFTAMDREGWLNNFVEEPELIEPADAPLRRGREHFAQSFDGVKAAGVKVVLTPLAIIVNGNEAAVHLKVEIGSGQEIRESSVIEIYTVADDGRIARMRAFLGH